MKTPATPKPKKSGATVPVTIEVPSEVLVRIGENRFRLPVPPPVRWGRIPHWMRKRMNAANRAARKNGQPEPYGVGMFGVGRWWDHYGAATINLFDGERQVLVAEPYGISDTDIENLQEFCLKLGGVRFFIEATGRWFPGRCPQVVIYEAQPQPAPQLSDADTNTNNQRTRKTRK